MISCAYLKTVQSWGIYEELRLRWWNSQNQIVRKIKQSNCEDSKTQMVIKLKLWWNSKIQIVTKLENSHCDETGKLTLMKLNNSNYGETQLKLGWNSKTQIGMKLKLKLWWNSKFKIWMKLKNSNCDETQKYKKKWITQTQIMMKLEKMPNLLKLKLKLWQNSKTQIVTKFYDSILQNSNCDKTEKVT